MNSRNGKQSETPQSTDWFAIVLTTAIVVGMGWPVVCTVPPESGGKPEFNPTGLIAAVIFIALLAVVAWLIHRGSKNARARAEEEMRELRIAIASKPKPDQLPPPTANPVAPIDPTPPPFTTNRGETELQSEADGRQP